ncbi:hypothetical protein IWZ00DRAFT_319442 [Phyllosticta capitalensis]
MIANIIGHELRKYTDTGQFPSAPAGLESHLGLDSCPSNSSDVCDALTAFTQVITTQLNIFGAFVNLSDGKTLRLVAGSWGQGSNTDALRLARSEADHETWLWLARRSIQQASGPDSANGTLVVDLVHDERTAHLPCVSEAPHLRYYAAAPLTTKLGISIGTLFFLSGSDHRASVSTNDLEFLGSVAKKCMSQLEVARQIYLRQRVERLCEALGSFVQYRSLFSQVHEEFPNLGSWSRHRSPPVRDGVAMTNQNIQAHMRSASGPSSSFAYEQAKEPPMSNGCAKSNGGPPKQSQETTYQHVFRRSAESLGEALDVDGVMFVNGLVGSKGLCLPFADSDQECRANISQKPRSRSADLASSRRPSINSNSPPPFSRFKKRRQRSESPGERIFASKDCEQKVLTRQPGEILGFWSRNSPISEREIHDETLRLDSLSEGFLQLLLERYPCGNIWCFEQDQAFAFCGDELREARSCGDASRLSRAFPGARQLIFAPLMDPVSLKLLAGCFAWTTQLSPVLTPESNIRPLRSFLHSVEAEISRIDTVATIKQQEAFVSAVSHELRTPLHGILGAVELFGETELDSFQQGLAESIRLAGTTLHDTLNSVLSYAQINQFERRRNKPEIHGHRKSTSESQICKIPDRSSYGLLSATDIATLCEETVEVTAGGHVYNNPNSMNDLVVTLDIQWQENWCFLTEPGALRRVMSNIIGNALKYTDKGFVDISLHVEDGEFYEHRSSPGRSAQKSPSPMVSPKTVWDRNETIERPASAVKDGVKHVVFTVTDSGKGMSRDFLEKHLFVPFTQEETGTTQGGQGVGLGMSIVKSLVALLDGKIHVRSQPRKGSSIAISIPMVEGSLVNAGAAISPAVHSISRLRSKRPAVAILGYPPSIKNCLNRYLLDWFQATVVNPEEEACEPDILIIDQTDQSAIEDAHFKFDAERVALLGVGRSLSLRRTSGAFSQQDFPVHVRKTTCRPIGPNKLAKSLLACLEDPGNGTSSSRSSQSQTSTLSAVEHMEVDPPSPVLYDVPSPTKRPRYCETLARENGSKANPAPLLTQIPHLKQSSSPPAVLQPDVRKRDSQHDSPLTTPTTATGPSNALAMVIDEQRRCRPSSARPRLLLVDDNDVNLMLLTKIMQKHGYTNYEVARNGEQAVEAFERAQAQGVAFDIVFMDMMMPVLDGFAATRAIRAIETRPYHHSHPAPPTAAAHPPFSPPTTTAAATLQPNYSNSPTPPSPATSFTAQPKTEPMADGTTRALIVALTALSSRAEADDARAAGADVVLSKPFLQGRVVEVVEGWVRRFDGGSGG